MIVWTSLLDAHQLSKSLPFSPIANFVNTMEHKSSDIPIICSSQPVKVANHHAHRTQTTVDADVSRTNQLKATCH
jgi:hypothetical protein